LAGAAASGLYFSVSNMIAASGTMNVILGGIKGLIVGGLGGLCISMFVFGLITLAIWDTKILDKILGIKNE
jgi:hypothetical protein